jgi:hypothetical protein
MAFEGVMLTGPLIRAARSLAGMTAGELSAATKLGLATIKRAEASRDATTLTAANADRIVRAFAERGVEFLDPKIDGQGVRVKRL